jgi:UDP-N-acetylmuramate--alanine ligase
MFATLAGRSASVLVNADDPACRTLNHASSFGMAETATTRPETVEMTTPGIRFTMDGVAFASDLPGEHNLANVLAALATCRLLGCGLSDLARALPHAGQLHRRFERVPTRSGVAVFDDYAHNPAKIRAVLRTAQALSPRVFALYQPHGFGPTRFTRDELVETIATTARPEDEFLMLPIYYAGGTAQKDITSADIVEELQRRAVKATAPPSREAALALLTQRAGPTDLVLSMGARDPSLSGFARAIAVALDQRP